MKKRSVAALSAVCVSAILCACTSEPAVPASSDASVHRILIDTDAGADDAAAILLAAVSDNAVIEGVSVLPGNVSLEQGLDNVISILEFAGKKDIPVCPGETVRYNGDPIEPFSVFGEDGLGDAGLVNPKGKPSEKAGVDLILDTVKANPGEIELIMLGPATNVARAIEKDPETMKKTKRIWTMGTAGFGKGNATEYAEFNVYGDVEAYNALIESCIPLTVVGLDMDSEETWFYPEHIEKLKQAGGCAAFLSDACAGILKYKEANDGFPYADLPDAVTMGCILWDDYATEITLCDAACVTEQGERYGGVFFTPVSPTDSNTDAHISLVTASKKTEFTDRLTSALAE